MIEPPVSCRRIDHLRAIAFDSGFTNEDAKQFGKLSKTATWEALLELYLVDGESLDILLDRMLDTVDTTEAKMILEVEGVSKGGSSKYNAAEAEHKHLLGEG